MLRTEQIRWSMPDSLCSVPDEGGKWGASDPVTEAAITGAALVRHLEDFRFASLRALRQLHRALGAERVAIGLMAADGHSVHEELAWAGGFGRCGESERVISCEAFAAEMSAWLATESGAGPRKRPANDHRCDAGWAENRIFQPGGALAQSADPGKRHCYPGKTHRTARTRR